MTFSLPVWNGMERGIEYLFFVSKFKSWYADSLIWTMHLSSCLLILKDIHWDKQAASRYLSLWPPSRCQRCCTRSWRQWRTPCSWCCTSSPRSYSSDPWSDSCEGRHYCPSPWRRRRLQKHCSRSWWWRRLRIPSPLTRSEECRALEETNENENTFHLYLYHLPTAIPNWCLRLSCIFDKKLSQGCN